MLHLPGSISAPAQPRDPSHLGCTHLLVNEHKARLVLLNPPAARALTGIREPDDLVTFEAGNGGLPKAILRHACGSSAEVYLFGACVTSWKQPTGDEVLFVRPDAKFDGSKPISGGLPHCFPQFGPGAMQQHGFARNLEWAVASSSADPMPDDRDPCLELVLEPSTYTREMWPHDFRLVYTVTLHGEELHTDYRVINTGSEPFDFTAALHSYFEVLDIEQARVTGLAGLKYLDKADDPSAPAEKVEDREAVTFGAKLVDSVYLDSPSEVRLEVGTGAAIAVQQSGWSDTVVWNPHVTMEASYRQFVCVESAKVKELVTVAPGTDWRGTANFAVVAL